MTPGIYEYENRLDGMAYGGSSADIGRRWKQHLSALRNDKHHCAYLQSAWNKYGAGVFEFRVLEVIEGADERLTAEQAWLDERHAKGTCYNAARDATAPMLGRKHSDEARRKQREASMGNQSGVGYRLTERHKQRISAANTGRPVSEGTRQKQSAAKMGKLHPMWGKHHTEETKWKMRAAQKQRRAREKALRVCELLNVFTGNLENDYTPEP